MANVGPGDRFDEPTVVGVDFPTVAFREASWDPDAATLTVTPVGVEIDGRQRTTFRVTNIGDPTRWTADGPVAADVQLRTVGADIEIEMPVRSEAVLLRGPEHASNVDSALSSTEHHARTTLGTTGSHAHIGTYTLRGRYPSGHSGAHA